MCWVASSRRNPAAAKIAACTCPSSTFLQARRNIAPKLDDFEVRAVGPAAGPDGASSMCRPAEPRGRSASPTARAGAAQRRARRVGLRAPRPPRGRGRSPRWWTDPSTNAPRNRSSPRCNATSSSLVNNPFAADLAQRRVQPLVTRRRKRHQLARDAARPQGAIARVAPDRGPGLTLGSQCGKRRIGRGTARATRDRVMRRLRVRCQRRRVPAIALTDQRSSTDRSSIWNAGGTRGIARDRPNRGGADSADQEWPDRLNVAADDRRRREGHQIDLARRKAGRRASAAGPSDTDR